MKTRSTFWSRWEEKLETVIRGPAEFHVKDHRGKILGPFCFSEVLARLKSGSFDGLEQIISLRDNRWRPMMSELRFVHALKNRNSGIFRFSKNSDKETELIEFSETIKNKSAPSSTAGATRVAVDLNGKTKVQPLNRLRQSQPVIVVQGIHHRSWFPLLGLGFVFGFLCLLWLFSYGFDQDVVVEENLSSPIFDLGHGAKKFPKNMVGHWVLQSLGCADQSGKLLKDYGDLIDDDLASVSLVFDGASLHKFGVTRDGLGQIQCITRFDGNLSHIRTESFTVQSKERSCSELCPEACADFDSNQEQAYRFEVQNDRLTLKRMIREAEGPNKINLCPYGTQELSQYRLSSTEDKFQRPSN